MSNETINFVEDKAHHKTMTLAQAQKIATHGGYYIREGATIGPDDRLGRWYIGRRKDPFFCPFGPGHRSRKAAWIAAAERAEEDSMIVVLHADLWISGTEVEADDSDEEIATMAKSYVAEARLERCILDFGEAVLVLNKKRESARAKRT